jgi:hypothetical protein
MPSIRVPDDWTPAQAAAVFEFIDEVKEAIMIRYQIDIVEYIRSQRCEENDKPSEPLGDGYDPF